MARGRYGGEGAGGDDLSSQNWTCWTGNNGMVRLRVVVESKYHYASGGGLGESRVGRLPLTI